MIRLYELHLLFFPPFWLWCPEFDKFCWAERVLQLLGLWLPRPDKDNCISILILWTYSLIELIGVSELHGLNILDNPFLKVNVTVADVLVELFEWGLHVDLVWYFDSSWHIIERATFLLHLLDVWVVLDIVILIKVLKLWPQHLPIILFGSESTSWTLWSANILIALGSLSMLSEILAKYLHAITCLGKSGRCGYITLKIMNDIMRLFVRSTITNILRSSIYILVLSECDSIVATLWGVVSTKSTVDLWASELLSLVLALIITRSVKVFCHFK